MTEEGRSSHGRHRLLLMKVMCTCVVFTDRGRRQDSRDTCPWQNCWLILHVTVHHHAITTCSMAANANTIYTFGHFIFKRKLIWQLGLFKKRVGKVRVKYGMELTVGSLDYNYIAKRFKNVNSCKK